MGGWRLPLVLCKERSREERDVEWLTITMTYCIKWRSKDDDIVCTHLSRLAVPICIRHIGKDRQTMKVTARGDIDFHVDQSLL